MFYAHNKIFNANIIEDCENCHVDPVQGFLQLSNKVEKGANEIQGVNQQLVRLILGGFESIYKSGKLGHHKPFNYFNQEKKPFYLAFIILDCPI